jgi:hypothetical protein
VLKKEWEEIEEEKNNDLVDVDVVVIRSSPLYRTLR